MKWWLQTFLLLGIVFTVATFIGCRSLKTQNKVTILGHEFVVPTQEAIAVRPPYTNKLPTKLVYEILDWQTNTVYWIRYSTGIGDEWVHEQWTTNRFVTSSILPRIESRFFQAIPIRHGESLRIGIGQPQPPDL